MRKAYRAPGSRSSCPLCHPAKAGWERRWKPKEEASLRQFEHEVRDMIGRRKGRQMLWDDF